ncbi:MAG: hypothetical protein JJE25_09685 [Bacteroidia bacterium]|nr:hypothetical protein [Bacteroidia bacterium]
MKKTFLVISAGIAFTLGACNSATTTSGDKDAKVQSSDSSQVFDLDTSNLATSTVFYQCPMDLEVISDKQGSCPKCGMDLEQVVKN